ncbi:MAG: winged helix-turn-helix domain-containing protein [Burkholderiaceae bacterium]|nr:winged helix-turn-helix domain-containing protein [Burkholderiales bacterium]MCZ8338765.1 winged helix-turn-helix domain-containing protein [Burkholderiaceae bacterium]
MRTKHSAAVSVRLRFSDDGRLGPGKIALLEAVGRSGSIAAAGRDMSMSYRRAWLLIDSLNRMFDEPVVHASPGGANGGGATLSPLGHELVGAYRAMEADTVRAIARHFEALRGRMVARPPGADGEHPGTEDTDDSDDSDARGPGTGARG